MLHCLLRYEVDAHRAHFNICGIDLRAIYRDHLWEGPEAYQGVIGSHEPAGQVIDIGPEWNGSGSAIG